MIFTPCGSYFVDFGPWQWEYDVEFDAHVTRASLQIQTVSWVTSAGEPMVVSGEVMPNTGFDRIVTLVENGETVGDVSQLVFRDPDTLHAGELHRHFPFWEKISMRNPSPKQQEVVGWIRNKVSIATYFHHFTGSFQREYYDSDLPPPKLFKNNGSCQPFTQFIHKTLLARLRSGAISLVGKVGYVTPPHLVLPLTVEPGKPHLCHDARFLNLWMEDKPFTLDCLGDLPRYVSQDSYQTVLDDKSGYDHIFLFEDSRTFVGFQWGGWYFTYNTLPFLMEDFAVCIS